MTIFGFDMPAWVLIVLVLLIVLIVLMPVAKGFMDEMNRPDPKKGKARKNSKR